MTKLKLGAIPDDKPVKLNIELPADIHRDLVAYAEVLARETGQKNEPVKLVAPMLARFMATDRGFAKARKEGRRSKAATTVQRSGNGGI
ncbi:DUF2274 domain-containing protein [Psychromarinibacter sp. C21-152]|uniref:DUF2274 domain-containing protein n=1 Tax=Psychromarinibacter sediminicola TaxID=3033385 RepID=A0AAE3NVY6_9RHOB|nr:DUF2274 domain-containing protein [Psychromarinibacter sediminicola]MDF0601637.1 DUF2274 domain-containing protein [Psychromarinibacter sediminicola]